MGRLAIECLGQVNESSSENHFVIHCFFHISIKEEDNGAEECESLFENHIGILIECYQNDLEVTCISSLIKYFDSNCQNTFWSMLISLVSRSILKNRSYVSKFERYWKL